MSLIPSESYSFPNHFTSKVVPSRRPKKAKPELMLEKARKKPPVKKIPLLPTLKPKVRWNNRAPAMDPARAHNNGNSNGASEVLPPAQNVIPMKPVKLARPPQPAPPKVMPVQREMRPTQTPAAPPPKARTPAPVISNPQTDFFEMFAESGQAVARRRRQMKFRRFIACETGALLVLLPLVILGLTANITAPALRWILNIFTIAAAVAVAVIPIIFYAFTPTLPEIER